MATRTIKPKRDDTMLTEWHSQPEVAPSLIRKEGTLTAQILLFAGFFLGLVGILALVAPLTGWSYFLGPGKGYACLTVGLILTLYHCYVDPEAQLRRLYGLAGLALAVIGVAIRIFPFQAGMGAYFLPVGVPLLFVALLYLVGLMRGETDPFWRLLVRSVFLGLGATGLVYGIGRGFFDADFLTTEGVVVMVLGLGYLTSFLGVSHESDGLLAHNVTLGLGITGALILVAAMIRSWLSAEFFIPSGLILAAVGFVAMVLSYASLSDRPTLVLARRELMSYFCSPVAYLVTFGLLFIFGFHFYVFVQQVADVRGGMFENQVVESYILSIFPVIAVMMLIPVLTMRLLSEEQRSGSLEVLLTAPLNESSVVLGKFLAAWVFFLVAWSPFFLFMVAFRIFGDEAFDYRPLLGFFLALATTGAGFLAMGLFFSSLTSNQIVAAVLTFAGMLLALGLHWLRSMSSTGGLQELFSYLSFLELWWETSRGLFPLRYFVLHASVAVFFLFLTTLALSARKWK